MIQVFGFVKHVFNSPQRFSLSILFSSVSVNHQGLSWPYNVPTEKTGKREPKAENSDGKLSLLHNK